MDFQTMKSMIENDLNDPNSKMYNNLKRLVASYIRRKDISKDLRTLTKFLDDEVLPQARSKSKFKLGDSLRVYCVLNGIDSEEKYPKCSVCGKPRTFGNCSVGFNLTCGNRRCFQSLDEVNQKRQSTARGNYGSLKSAYHDTSVETMNQKYGAGNVSKLDWVKQQKVETSRKNWGTDYPWQSKEGKDLQRKGVYKKYGVNNISQLSEVKQKKIETSFKNWGFDNPSKSPEVLNRIIETWIAKYGVENISQCLQIHRKKLDKTSKTYVTKNRKEFLYEGNEIIFLEQLIEIYGEENVYSQPELYIEYYDQDLQYRVWFPDFNVMDPNSGLEHLIEAKFLWNLEVPGRINLLKHRLLSENEYYKLELIICDDRTQEQPIYKVFCVDSGNDIWKLKLLTSRCQETNFKKVSSILENLGFQNIRT